MKKIIILICIMLMLMSVAPVQAKTKEPTGDRIWITNPPATYPADTPFYFAHGWLPEESYLYPRGAFDFQLQVDGSYIKESYVDRIKSDTGFTILWYFNFPDGLSGTHTFIGHWFAPCAWALDNGYVTECQNPTAPIEAQLKEATIEFTNP